MVFLAAALMAVGVVAVACGGGDNKETAGSKPEATQSTTAGGKPEATQPATATEAEVKLEIDDFYFDPKSIEATAGTPVKVRLDNEGKAAHTFTIGELGVDKVLQPGEEATVEFTPTADGTLAFYCRFHRGQGMEGELTVSGSTGSNVPSAGGASAGGPGGAYSTGY